MRWVLTILLLLQIARAQSINWTTGNEAIVANYIIENSHSDTLNGWQTFAVIAPGQSSYTYPIPDLQQYWRVHATGLADFYTKALLYTSTQTSISVWGINSFNAYVNIYWTSINENNLNSYTIDRSFDGVTFTQVGSLLAKGNSNYTININRPTKTTGWLWWRKTVIDSRKGIYRINAISSTNQKSLLKTVSE